MPLRATPLLAITVAGLGIFLPLFGASLLVVLLADRFLLRRMPALAHWFDVKPQFWGRWAAPAQGQSPPGIMWRTRYRKATPA